MLSALITSLPFAQRLLWRWPSPAVDSRLLDGRRARVAAVVITAALYLRFRESLLAGRDDAEADVAGALRGAASELALEV